jgi:hypothetical protein
MPRWIYQSEPDSAPPSEQRVAEMLGGLGPDFLIRWGFFYADGHGMTREGDFLIQGPDGHLLVMECKGGELAWNPDSGRWSTADGENPFSQLDQEWSGALRTLRDQADILELPLPYIDRVLALPDMWPDPQAVTFLGQPRDRVISGGELQDFASWWTQRLGGRHRHASLQQARQLFSSVYAVGLASDATSHTLDFADQILERQMVCRFEILDALADNRQLLFGGGPGTGKTWLAIELAARWAKAGHRVLFLCYNLELEAWLRPVCAKKSKLIDIFSYESLAARLGVPRTPGLHGDDITRFFDHDIPTRLLALTGEAGFVPPYDALVVDEAQDHNTGEGDPASDRAGWWRIYFRLLSEGAEAPLAVFYDEAQRLPLRHGRFSIADLGDSLIAPVHVRLRRPLRYTRQLRKFFAGLCGDHTRSILRDFLSPTPGLAEGPEPEIRQVDSDQSEAKACADLVKAWTQSHLVREEDVVVLFPSARRPPSWIGKVHGVNFHLGDDAPRGSVRAIAIHRAKGLERRAVILVGFAPWEETAKNDYKAMTFIMGATRARHILAVVERVPAASRT